LLGNRQAQAGSRLAALAALFDQSTVRHFETLGVGDGWHCWEVGAGGPTVPAWLAARSGPGGRVLATDIDVAWLADADGGFEVRVHDVGAELPPGGEFDLVHARLVLGHVARREHALASMAAALRPGGWLLLEEADPALQPLVCLEEHSPAQQRANKLKQGFRTLMRERGVELAFGRSLPRLLRSAGLTDVTADAYFPVTGPACAALEHATVLQTRDRLIAAGLATDAEIAEHLASVESGTLDLATSPMISAWGRKPA
jgi:SAM-dependent methyltransferase